MIIRKNNSETKRWFKFGGKVEFLVGLMKFSELTLGKSVTQSILAKERFDACLLDWKGLTEEDGKTALEFNDENKTNIYDYYSDATQFIFEKIKELQGELEKSVKN